MDKRQKQKKGILHSRFYRIYFSVVALALIGIAVGLVWLNGVVRDYEVAQPVYVAQDVAKLFEDGDYARIYALDTSAEDISDGDEAFYVESLRALAEGRQVRWREAFSSDDREKRYTVTLDGDRFATFTLVPSGQTTEHGNTLWQLGAITTNVALEGSSEAGDPAAAPYRVKAPAGYTVTVDGRALTEADAVSTGIAILPENFLPSGVEVPTLTEYGFFSDSDAPAVVVTDADGEAQTVEKQGDAVWTCGLRENAEFREKYSSAIISLGTKIAKYTAKDLSQGSVLSGVASDSPAEKTIKRFSNYWAPSHKSSTVKNAVVSDFYVLSDSCFTCHLEFDFVLKSRRGNEYVYPTAYTFCVIKRKGTGKLYNLVFH